MPSPVGTEMDGRDALHGGDQLGCERNKALGTWYPSFQVWLVIGGVTEKGDWREFPVCTTGENEEKRPEVKWEYITNDTGVRIVSCTYITDMSNNYLDRTISVHEELVKTRNRFR
jgi:hypothetical protein